MSSRLTTPVSKLTRSFTTSPAVARPSHLLNNASKTATGVGRKTKPAVNEEPTDKRTHSTQTRSSSPHRPLAPSSTAARTPAKPIPFMQTFHHSAPKPAPTSYATIDRAVLPNLHLETSQYDPYARIRVPLLPDNTSPPAGMRQPEASDGPLPQPEVLVVAGEPNPGQVVGVLTETEGMRADGVELGFAHMLGREHEKEESFEMGRGMIRDLWKGMVEDVLSIGQGKKGPAAA
ncbi:hypothetical protein VTI74DRAFT_8790 [Chaetomium olivicolor]